MILAGIAANMPVALAPGMGLNAYFAYQVRPETPLRYCYMLFLPWIRCICSTSVHHVNVQHSNIAPVAVQWSQ